MVGGETCGGGPRRVGAGPGRVGEELRVGRGASPYMGVGRGGTMGAQWRVGMWWWARNAGGTGMGHMAAKGGRRGHLEWDGGGT